jgi:hypothetical protein
MLVSSLATHVPAAQLHFSFAASSDSTILSVEEPATDMGSGGPYHAELERNKGEEFAILRREVYLEATQGLLSRT